MAVTQEFDPFETDPGDRMNQAGFPRRVLMLLLACSLPLACATTRAYTIDKPLEPPANARVLLMPCDSEVSVITAGGVLAPQAEWTTTAQGFLRESMTAYLESKNFEVRQYERSASGPADPAEAQLLVLQRAVSQAILTHKYGQPVGTKWLGLVPVIEILPTLKNTFSWNLGENVRALGSQYQSRYALFTNLRDAFQSEGRVAVSVIVGLLFGQSLPTPPQTGFASLVDLETGDVVWFNSLVYTRMFFSTSDPRESGGAQKVVKNLLDKLPL